MAKTNLQLQSEYHKRAKKDKLLEIKSYDSELKKDFEEFMTKNKLGKKEALKKLLSDSKGV